MPWTTHGTKAALRTARFLAGADRTDTFALCVYGDVRRIAMSAAAAKWSSHAPQHITNGTW
jgi:hypothetical protein